MVRVAGRSVTCATCVVPVAGELANLDTIRKSDDLPNKYLRHRLSFSDDLRRSKSAAVLLSAVLLSAVP